MQIFGLDFTSVPGPRKAITWLQAHLEKDSLYLDASGALTTFVSFEAFLARPGPWLAGMDFPFGQPRKLIENIGWPRTWAGYVAHIAAMSKPEFVTALGAYRQDRPVGDKQHLRYADKLADSRSPMMLYGVPVGKMFFEGAPRLLRSGASILPCHPTADQRIILETYPALVARRWIGKQGYKNDTRQKQTHQQKTARQTILQNLLSGSKQYFGFEIQVTGNWVESLIEDASGDQLDALLCAVQAAWAYTQKDHNYGIPANSDPLEGWIVDPQLV
jgi:hypothetical protein